MSEPLLDFGTSGTTGSPSHLSPDHSRSEALATHKRFKANSASLETDPAIIDDLRSLAYTLVEQVLQQTHASLSHTFQWYYTRVETLCKAKHIEQTKLADHIRQKIDETFNSTYKPSIHSLLQDSLLEDEFWTQLLKLYDDWEKKVLLLKTLFIYLDRSYLATHPYKPTIVKQSRVAFSHALTSEFELFRPKLGALHLLHLEDSKYDSLLRKILMVLQIQADVKVNNLVTTMIVANARLVASQWDDHYFGSAIALLRKEMSFFKSCEFGLDLKKKLLLDLKWALLFNDFQQLLLRLLPSFVPWLVDNIAEKGHVMKDLLILCKETKSEYSLDTLKMFTFCWREYVQLVVTDIFEASGPKKVVNVVSEIHTKTTKLAVLNTYVVNVDLSKETLRAVQEVCTHSKWSSVYMSHLCKYCDSVIKSNDTFTREVAKRAFDRITSPEEFTSLYKRDVSRRLLLGRTSHSSADEDLANYLLKDVQNDEVDGLRGMFKDLKISKQKYSHMSQYDTGDFSVLLLDQRNWPEVPRYNITIPPQLEQVLNSFTQTYTQTNRKNQLIDWKAYSLHQITIEASFKTETKDLTMNLLQASVLYLFQDKNSFLIEELMVKTDMDERLLKTVLGSFCDRYAILVFDGRVYTYNEDFKDKSGKIRVPFAREREPAKATTSKQAKGHEYLRALVVRTMKIHKQLVYTDLLANIITQATEKGYTIAEVKKNVELLITDEYIERQSDGHTLVYIP